MTRLPAYPPDRAGLAVTRPNTSEPIRAWKDFVVDPHDVTVRVVSPTERDVTCVVPTFWSRIPRFAHLKYVRITVDGRTLSLPWPPSDQPDAVERTATASRVSPALTMHLRLHGDPDQAPTAVAWDDQKQ